LFAYYRTRLKIINATFWQNAASLNVKCSRTNVTEEDLKTEYKFKEKIIPKKP